MSVWKEAGVTCGLQSLPDIHFSRIYSDHSGNKSLVIALAIAAMGVLVIACVNFVNLFLATSFLHSREVGIKKVFGAARGTLMKAFCGTTAMYIFIAGVGAIVHDVKIL